MKKSNAKGTIVTKKKIFRILAIISLGLCLNTNLGFSQIPGFGFSYAGNVYVTDPYPQYITLVNLFIPVTGGINYWLTDKLALQARAKMNLLFLGPQTKFMPIRSFTLYAGVVFKFGSFKFQ
ncbi:hypothetical protein ACFLT1_09375 [Bacteroidota bacterium]